MRSRAGTTRATFLWLPLLCCLFALVALEDSRGPTSLAATAPQSPSIVHGTPLNYLALLPKLRPGDTLLLAPGLYKEVEGTSGLPVFHLKGVASKPITITGPDDGPRSVFYANSARNTVRIADSSFVAIRNLVLDGQGLDVDAVKAEGVSDHITLENLCIKNHGNNQQTVGISTKAPAWDWVIRGNIILGAGTGIYLGDSDGSKPFIHGLIEYNLIRDTIGYNIEIKHQLQRPNRPGMPAVPGATIIRHNVFSKAENGSTGGMARPNLLVGHFPPTGLGAEDVYEIYGNFFYENPTGEALFQGEGNLAVYNNLFWNDRGDAILIRPHNARPRKVDIFWNTVVSRDIGIKVTGGLETYRQRVFGNVVFASSPIEASDITANLVSSHDTAATYLQHPELPLGKLDLSPRTGKLANVKINQSLIAGYDDAFLDFDQTKRQEKSLGAYEEAPSASHWLPVLQTKPMSGLSSTPSSASCPVD